MEKIDREIKLLPAGHPAKGPYGLFLQAKENIRGNIVIGLGNRLNVFQDKLVDALTADSTIDLTLPGHKPCAYFCILSAQDHTYAFLSSLFFTMIFSRLEQYARRETEDGKLPVPVNFVLDEFPSIGKLGDFKRSIAFTRGFRMNCIVIVQSIAQLADIYPRREWEEITACCDATICLGVNDTTSAQFISEKCGMTTIRVTNNQQPQTPLFSPVANLSRPYSQTRSNTQRALMQPDEVLRLDNAKSIVMLRGQLPMLLYKVTPPEFADFKKLRTLSIAKYHGKTNEVEEEPRKTQTKQPKRSAEQAVYANLLHFEKRGKLFRSGTDCAAVTRDTRRTEPRRKRHMKQENNENRPSFGLMKLNNIISYYHMQMPRWLFSDSGYSDMTLESKGSVHVSAQPISAFPTQRLGEPLRRGLCYLHP